MDLYAIVALLLVSIGQLLKSHAFDRVAGERSGWSTQIQRTYWEFQIHAMLMKWIHVNSGLTIRSSKTTKKLENVTEHWVHNQVNVRQIYYNLTMDFTQWHTNTKTYRKTHKSDVIILFIVDMKVAYNTSLAAQNL